MNSKPKLFQINVCLNYSTGKIAQQIGEAAINKGWESWIAYSGREDKVSSKSQTIRIGSFLNSCIHYGYQLVFDMEGLCSDNATYTLIRKIEEVQPDILLLHVIHDHWLNYRILFDYCVKRQFHVVWVQHDCWSFTGGCMYFDMLECNHWKQSCDHCPDKRSLFNRSKKNLSLKKNLFSKVKSLTFVSVSDWIAGLLRDSINKERLILTIHNGIDTQNYNFDIKEKNNNKSKVYKLLGVAGVWAPRKGLDDFIKLRTKLPITEFSITLVGLTNKQIRSLPEGIIGVEKTQNEKELARLYAEADIYINPTYSDNFPTTNIEALASGTPVITYNTGGSPEAVDIQTGRVVEQGDIKSLVREIYSLRENPISAETCRNRAVDLFNKDKCYENYLNLFDKLLSQNRE